MTKKEALSKVKELAEFVKDDEVLSTKVKELGEVIKSGK